MESFISNPWFLFIVLVWTLPWKGVALWKAARAESRNWFVWLFILNTFAILEILYIFIFSKRKKRVDTGTAA